MPLAILLIEDNPGDAALMKVAFQESNSASSLTVVRDGEEAVHHLEALLQHCERLPNLILLDLNLPKVDGFEVLKHIKATPELRRIPVLILSSSTSPEDTRKAYELHANCYLGKSTSLDGTFDLVRAIEAFWLGFAQLSPPLQKYGSV